MNMTVDQPTPYYGEEARTLADARQYVLTCEGLSEQRRRDLLSGLSGIERVCGLPAAAIALSCPNLRGLLYRREPAAFGFTPQRFGKLLTALRFPMRGMGLHAPQPSKDRLSEAWRSLFDALPGPLDEKPGYRQTALSGIIGCASDAGFEPGDVPADILARFEACVTDLTLEELTREPGAADGVELELGARQHTRVVDPPGIAPAAHARALHAAPGKLPALVAGRRAALPQQSRAP